MPQRINTKNTKVKCLYDCILNYLGLIYPLLKANVDLIPHRYIPIVSGIPKAKQFM